MYTNLGKNCFAVMMDWVNVGQIVKLLEKSIERLN